MEKDEADQALFDDHLDGLSEARRGIAAMVARETAEMSGEGEGDGEVKK